jgi:hypothetical protein
VKKAIHQVRTNRSANRAAKQATKKTGKLKDQLAALVTANDKTDDCLWALPNGRLFLWSGFLKETPREVSLQAARDWWNKFQSHSPHLAAPFFPEDSAAAEIVNMVCKAVQKHTNASEASPKHASIRNLEANLYSALNQNAGILALLEHHVLNPNDDGKYNDNISCGIASLVRQTNARLQDAAESVLQRMVSRESAQPRIAA